MSLRRRGSAAFLLGREDLPSGAALTSGAVRDLVHARQSTPRLSLADLSAALSAASSIHALNGGEPAIGAEEQALLPRVLVIYTGGTIGMKAGPNGYEPVPNYLKSLLRSLPMFHDPSAARGESLATPLSVFGQHIAYDILEFSPLLDSSCMGMAEWAKVAAAIQQNYHEYDGFLVLHGTDTLAYTASALSFMLENLGKTVVITGAQIPITEHLNDAYHNLLGALTVCGHFIIPEVSVFFAGKLYRGCRVTKMDAAHVDAFASPNLPPLAEMGTGVVINWNAIFVPPDPLHEFSVTPRMVPHVAVLHLFPGIHLGTMRAFCRRPIEGIVLQTFGTGNVFDGRSDVLQLIREAVAQEILVINCTQCVAGSVSDRDATGRALLAAGALPGYDMTTEAALTKLCYVLGKEGLSHEQRMAMMTTSLRGELTVPDPGPLFSLPAPSLVHRVASAMRASSKRETEMVGNALYPVLLSAAAADARDEQGLAELRAMEAEAIRTSNFPALEVDVSEFRSLRHGRWFYDSLARTPLHTAAVCGNTEAVKLLLLWNASVHARDALGHTPLVEAVRARSAGAVDLLVGAGAKLALAEAELGTELCIAAAENDVALLRLWHAAGANMAATNATGRCPLDVALRHQKKEAADFLAAIHRAEEEVPKS